MAVFVWRITVISPLQKEAFIYFTLQEQELCVVHLQAFVAPVLGAEWAWYKMLIIPHPENSFWVFLILRGILMAETLSFFL